MVFYEINYHFAFNLYILHSLFQGQHWNITFFLHFNCMGMGVAKLLTITCLYKGANHKFISVVRGGGGISVEGKHVETHAINSHHCSIRESVIGV